MRAPAVVVPVARDADLVAIALRAAPAGASPEERPGLERAAALPAGGGAVRRRKH
ncbi:hypothetical protein [Streptomyces puniciscabiei]|uniref:hypothetical protein n=1 Tax=Streptomyces puniciscabiei TaxID=164348 RepID=UPI000A9DB474|nr:hypothetical protein [Streptomyces puniciscabiei]